MLEYVTDPALLDAIKHADKVADSYSDTDPDCDAARLHRQRAYWLRELDQLRAYRHQILIECAFPLRSVEAL